MQPTYAIARSVMLRVLGVCLFATFWSQIGQLPGLIGSHGLTPLADTMQSLRAHAGGAEPLRVPTLFWLSTDDSFLMGLLWLGVLASVLLVLGVAPRLCCGIGYVVELSLRGQETGVLRWCNWPFDDLLTEVAFVAMLAAPAGLWAPPWRLHAGRAWQRWLYLWILLRLMLGPGLTKLFVGGGWHDLSAVEHFLLTQPFPTTTAMWLHGQPRLLLQGATLFTLASEVIAPWFYLWPGRTQRWAALSGLLLSAGIWLGGSYRGFNLMTMALLLLLCEDRWLLRWVPSRWREQTLVAISMPGPRRWLHSLGAAFCVLLVGAASVAPIGKQFFGATWEPPGAWSVRLAPLHLASSYFMFCVAPNERLGLVVQGSNDGVDWRDYQPRALVAAVDRRPRRPAPANDWLGFTMCFAAYGPPEMSAAWLPPLLAKLRQGEPAVRRLFAIDPFPERPPQRVRAALYSFRYASAEQRAAGVYWQREFVAVHLADH